jgi:hypothetical protein
VLVFALVIVLVLGQVELPVQMIVLESASVKVLGLM